MTNTHMHLINSLEESLPILRDAERIAEYLIKIKANYPIAFTVNERLQALHQKLMELGEANNSPSCPSLITAQN